ncbi:ABC transporter permease [Gracilibacillus oryzae]|uniref:ABC transporter permease n=1 Tax=Gracilibacillus oryzae TaxID=1672701 RepID=A0A7C8GSI0_9BACI|nr:ABC transporter permease [Gracilibacillus oryzae]KAB8132924.1 ABC transporter permease [Gracilibacillus oryzae]
MIIEVLTGAIIAGTSVLYATTGELISERAGVINLGTEGSMVSGAMAAFAATAWSGSPWIGLAFGAIAGLLISLIHAFLVIDRKANQLATGLTIMFFGLGLSAFFGRSLVDKQINGFESIDIPLLSQIPFVGRILFTHDVLTYLSYLLVPAVWFFLFRTKWGIILRGAGENEQVVYAYGKSPKLVRYLAVMAGGLLAGVGGAQLSTAFTHTWIEGMTQGRGIIAVALVIFASWLPFRAMLGAYLFGGAYALQLALQGRGVDISQFLLFMLPYVLTLVAMFIVERKQRNMMPLGLKDVFEGGGN